MLTEKQIAEIKDSLDSCEKPFFIMDGDTDGLCSFLLFRRYKGSGEYYMLRDNPEVTTELLDRVERAKPDVIFVLDKPLMSQEFIDAINVPIIWIDHHMPVKRNGVRYYNPRVHDIHDGKSTSFLCYQVVKDDLWIAEMGIIVDNGLDHIDEFSKKYHGLIDGNIKEPYDILYNTKFGKMIKLQSFLLKGKSKDVNKNIEMMIKIKSPYELLNEESEKAKKLMRYSRKMEKIYDELLNDSLKTKVVDGLFLFVYHDNDKASFTGELSNEIMYKLPDKLVIIGREKDGKIIMSLRGNMYNIPKLLEKTLDRLNGRGGGHEHACGASIDKDQFNIFIERLKKLI